MHIQWGFFIFIIQHLLITSLARYHLTKAITQWVYVMRTGLSQRGWNNVLIFASLFMIILFNSTAEKFVNNETDTEQSTLIKSDAIIQSIDFSGIKLERVGASWRVMSELSEISNISSQSIANAWQHQKFEVLTQAPNLMDDISRFPVIIYAHGYDNVQIFEVIIEPLSDLAYVVNNNTKQWFILSIQHSTSLLPTQILTFSH